MSTICAAELRSFDRIDYLHCRNVQLGTVTHADGTSKLASTDAGTVVVDLASVVSLAPGEVLRTTYFPPAMPVDVYEGPEQPLPVRWLRSVPRDGAILRRIVEAMKAARSSGRAFCAYNPGHAPSTFLQVEAGRGCRVSVRYTSSQGATTHSIHRG